VKRKKYDPLVDVKRMIANAAADGAFALKQRTSLTSRFDSLWEVYG